MKLTRDKHDCLREIFFECKNLFLLNILSTNYITNRQPQTSKKAMKIELIPEVLKTNKKWFLDGN